MTFLSAYWLVFAAPIGSGLLIHFVVVVPVLRQHGHGPLTGWLSVSHYAELKAYKEICLAEGKPLIWWRVLVTIHVALLFGVVGWFILVYSHE